MSIPFQTTVIGSLPKPPWLYDSSGFSTKVKGLHGKGGTWAYSGKELREAHDDAVRLAIGMQESAGLDEITDGEQRRESYLSYVVRRLNGFDYETFGEKWVRGGRRLAQVGRCTGPVTWPGPMLVKDLRFTIKHSRTPVKVTLPGPMTVCDSILDEFYGNEESMAMAVADALNEEAKVLALEGASVIQFDEPVFSRYPDKVLAWGIEALDRSAHGVNAQTAVHVCYSYPLPGVPRPIVPSYPTILPALERSTIDQLALEFEAPMLSVDLLALCPSKTVLLGCITNTSEEVEDADRIANRLLEAVECHPAEKLKAAPDCGLVPISGSSARRKLRVMVEGARLARARLAKKSPKD